MLLHCELCSRSKHLGGRVPFTEGVCTMGEEIVYTVVLCDASSRV